MSFTQKIRFINMEDYPRVLEIYAPYIMETAISFEAEVPTLEAFSQRIEKISSKFPWLVYEENGQVLGYAYGSTHRSRYAYNWSCEVTVYLDQKHTKKGIGSSLYNQLFTMLKEQGFYNLFAGITQPNEASNRIHEKLGFKKIGTYENIGFKFSKWHDVSWYQLEINAGDNPQPPRPLSRGLKEKLLSSNPSPA